MSTASVQTFFEAAKREGVKFNVSANWVMMDGKPSVTLSMKFLQMSRADKEYLIRLIELDAQAER